MRRFMDCSAPGNLRPNSGDPLFSSVFLFWWGPDTAEQVIFLCNPGDLLDDVRGDGVGSFRYDRLLCRRRAAESSADELRSLGDGG